MLKFRSLLLFLMLSISFEPCCCAPFCYFGNEDTSACLAESILHLNGNKKIAVDLLGSSSTELKLASSTRTLANRLRRSTDTMTTTQCYQNMKLCCSNTSTIKKYPKLRTTKNKSTKKRKVCTTRKKSTKKQKSFVVKKKSTKKQKSFIVKKKSTKKRKSCTLKKQQSSTTSNNCIWSFNGVGTTEHIVKARIPRQR